MPRGGDYNELITSEGLHWDECGIAGGDRASSDLEFSCFFLYVFVTQAASFSSFFTKI